MYLFGSVVKNQMMWWSDIDLGIYTSHFSRLTSDNQLELFQELIITLEELINIRDYPLDIRFINQMPLGLQFQVLKEGVLVYNQAPKIHQEFIEYVLRNYADYAIWIDHYLNLVYAI